MQPLQIKTISWQNFLGYGDYESTINITGIGPTLIVGNNGAGKSSFLNAIVWCLFGRTIHRRETGDNVINWYGGQGCIVKIVTTDGWTITRTRNVSGKDELTITDSTGSSLDNTLSTNKSTQEILNKLFNLDYDIFVSSVFFGQECKSLLSKTDQQRKAILERMFGITKLNIIAGVANEKYKQLDTKLDNLNSRLMILTKERESLLSKLGSVRDEHAKHEQSKVATLQSLENDIVQLNNDINNTQLPDIDYLQEQWDIINKINSKLLDMSNKINEYDIKIRERESHLNYIEKSCVPTDDIILPDIDTLKKEHEEAAKRKTIIAKLQKHLIAIDTEISVTNSGIIGRNKIVTQWADKGDTTCQHCGQEISSDYANTCINTTKLEIESLQQTKDQLQVKKNELISSIETLKNTPDPEMSVTEAMAIIKRHDDNVKSIKFKEEQADTIRSDIVELRKAREVQVAKYTQIKASVSSSTPMTLAEANRIISRLNDLKSKLAILQERSYQVNTRINPYDQAITLINNKSKELDDKINELNTEISNTNIMANHVKYIYTSYNDRKKIKSFILSNSIPYLNERLVHYMDAFGCTSRIKFTAALGIENDKWSHEFFSGGEKKRIDLAIMFALHDVHVSVYGQQCNIIVLDEVEGSLDDVGIAGFIDVVNNDFSVNNQLDAILIISHKNEMLDAFPNKLKVTKENEFSFISTSE